MADNQRVNTERPQAVAMMQGSSMAPGLAGSVRFYAAPGGTIVKADVCGLPAYRPAQNGAQPVGPFGFHIHESGDCGMGADGSAFGAAGGHYNPTNQPHGNHAGDMPVLFATRGGCSHIAFYTDRFTPQDVVGRAVIIHLNPDDFRTEPAGNSGPRIGCGVIVAAPR